MQGACLELFVQSFALRLPHGRQMGTLEVAKVKPETFLFITAGLSIGIRHLRVPLVLLRGMARGGYVHEVFLAPVELTKTAAAPGNTTCSGETETPGSLVLTDESALLGNKQETQSQGKHTARVESPESVDELPGHCYITACRGCSSRWLVRSASVAFGPGAT